MPQSRSISTTRSALMHATLAHLSEEVRTVELIIARRSLATALATERSPECFVLSLPLDVLLEIRCQLIHTMIDHSILNSSLALSKYEQLLGRGLCHDCADYYREVYGDDLWQWSELSWSHAPLTCHCPNPSSSAFNPIEGSPILSRSEWLEGYLFNRAIPLLKRASISPHSQRIWDIVLDVLDHLGCYVVEHPESDSRSRGHVIVLASCRPGTASLLEGINSDAADDWSAQVALRRAERELCLDVQYPDPSNPPPYLSPSVGADMGVVNPSFPPRPTPPSFPPLLTAPLDLVSAGLVFMLRVATTPLMILFYYRNPAAFKRF